jgi:hypothetical protein
MLPVPTPVTDVNNRADWLELRALVAADRNASRSDLRRALVRSGVLADVVEGGAALDDEVLADDAFNELRERALSCGPAYPFIVEDGLLQAYDDISSYWPYIFCLLLSLQGRDRSEPRTRPTSIFEEVAEAAARMYVAGESMKFGFPRRVAPAGFMDAVKELCLKVREGIDARRRPSSRNAKDARLDIVAWRPFPDGRPAQLILFGQCAAGTNWPSKLTELQPLVFTDLYWTEPPAVPPVKAFFTPFRISSERWYEIAKPAGIVFDRCRIANFAFGAEPPPGVLQWNSRRLREEAR